LGSNPPAFILRSPLWSADEACHGGAVFAAKPDLSAMYDRGKPRLLLLFDARRKPLRSRNTSSLVRAGYTALQTNDVERITGRKPLGFSDFVLNNKKCWL